MAAASSEQAVGVAQINKAMSRVDQVTQRNASAAEELASTAEELASQAETLQSLIAFFRIGHNDATPTPATTTASPMPRLRTAQGSRRPASGSPPPPARRARPCRTGTTLNSRGSEGR